MFHKMLKAVGYNVDLDYKDKVAYPIAFLSLLIGIFYVVFYVFFIPYLYPILVHLIYILCMGLSIFLLKKKQYLLAKLIIVASFLVQETLAVFAWFSPDTGFHYFYFVVAPMTFFLFDHHHLRERRFLYASNVLAAFGLVLSELFSEREALYFVSSGMLRAFSISAAFSVVISIFFVFNLYALEVMKVEKELQLLANTDSLTKILNRRALYEQGIETFKIYQKYRHEFTLVVLDIDYFKKLNDAYGHMVGDEVLISLTQFISSMIRKTDSFSRFGGEEFAIILRRTTSEEGQHIINNMLNQIEHHDFILKNGEKLNITVSAGISQLNHEYDSFDMMMKAADDALYQAKADGRNRYCVANKK